MPVLSAPISPRLRHAVLCLGALAIATAVMALFGAFLADAPWWSTEWGFHVIYGIFYVAFLIVSLAIFGKSMAAWKAILLGLLIGYAGAPVAYVFHGFVFDFDSFVRDFMGPPGELTAMLFLVYIPVASGTWLLGLLTGATFVALDRLEGLRFLK